MMTRDEFITTINELNRRYYSGEIQQTEWMVWCAIAREMHFLHR
jgi:hypothetical protein